MWVDVAQGASREWKDMQAFDEQGVGSFFFNSGVES
jgi:hypothetical protein